MILARGLARAAPYAALLALAGWLYAVAGHIEYLGPADRIGPAFWPRAILVLLALLCVYEIAKSLLGRARSVDGVLQSMMAQAADSAEPAGEAGQPSLVRLAAGLGVTLGYVFLVDVLGFFLASAAYLAGFIRVGGYRRAGVAIAAGVLGSFALMIVFARIVYVSLPLGTGPFAAISIALMQLLGVR